ncbi:CoA transferase [Bradyrhizobium sp. AS23.2]|uniref:CaiB/BaiF CoA transferase family protein n=1 Tax=Bradyrhizobium sp. AS23.2 TaxID=1680155 RepID=UPI0009648123|nr:CoA transferase [Bradyrhizobium sp. AS23.2]OKO84564.1 acyl-CoA transferase [Bradyrhizobium sp. AS23.2]
MIQAYARDKKCPLDGVRVLDLSRLVAGNMLTHVLADLGADVVKVEPPEGDSLRAWKSNGISVQWKVYARNKRSIVIDLKKDEDRGIFRRLVASSQILVENFRPGVLDRLGFGLSELHKVQPKLVVLRISGWGMTGPYRDKPGFGTLVEAASGFAFKNGFPDREPLLPNLGLADSIAGLYGATAALVALREAEVGSGKGQEIDLSLLEPIISVLGADQAVFRATGTVPGRTGNRTALSAPRNIYITSDGKYVALSASTPEMAFRLFRAIDRPELCSDPRFMTNEKRVDNVEQLDEIIGTFIAARTLAQNLAHFEAAEVTVGPIYDAASLMEDPHVKARGTFVEMEDKETGSLPMHSVVARLSATPGAIRRPAPMLDEHRAEILRELNRERGGVSSV